MPVMIGAGVYIITMPGRLTVLSQPKGEVWVKVTEPVPAVPQRISIELVPCPETMVPLVTDQL